ncbi:MAG: hypothetical protein B7X06_02890 [Verrucomicrobia bacterium 21-51-4]|nr:MAG: hypothetical protein B7X06_02890 [Verrucomicrobia bacterium 21-51-4]
MICDLSEQIRTELVESLARIGQRPTPQREHVFRVLLSQRDHPTADEVYARAKIDMPTISLATVYNCLESLTACGLVRPVNIERESSRYCPNLSEHAHFHCRKTGRVYDIEIPQGLMQSLKKLLPQDCTAEDVQLAFHGVKASDNETVHRPQIHFHLS